MSMGVCRACGSPTATPGARGGRDELVRLFPALGQVEDGRLAVPADSADGKSRLLWTCTQFLSRLAAKTPLLPILENLQ